jgi:hypothetical protein
MIKNLGLNPTIWLKKMQQQRRGVKSRRLFRVRVLIFACFGRGFQFDIFGGQYQSGGGQFGKNLFDWMIKRIQGLVAF